MISQISQIFDDRTLNSLKMSMHVAGIRHGALASNIANINTPGYNRVDLTDEFSKNFADALRRLDKGERATDIGMPKPEIAKASKQGLPRMDGNTVNIEQESAELIKNKVDFDFASRLLSLRYAGLKAAITGRSA